MSVFTYTTPIPLAKYNLEIIKSCGAKTVMGIVNPPTVWTEVTDTLSLIFVDITLL